MARGVGSVFLLRSYMQVFLLQWFILLININPVMIINSSVISVLNWKDLLSLAIWCLGFFFESVGDYQLDRFVRDPGNKGKIMNHGLWRYSRHPNYFGEVTMWWGIFTIGLSVPGGVFGILGPILITTMILFVSGIPMTERPMMENPLFQQYCRETSSFFPWFPKRVKEK
jgi:steroid 5-alpha reductase family enzyme